jgi:hypothetical protein
VAKKRKKTFKCDECPRKKFTCAMDLSAHFKENPKHRNHRQHIQFEYSQSVRAERLETGEIQPRRSVNGLPTTKRVQATRITNKFCTQCGVRSKAAHNFCGCCGVKL